MDNDTILMNNTQMSDLLDQVKQHIATLQEWASTVDEMMEDDATTEDINAMVVLEHHLQVAVEELTW